MVSEDTLLLPQPIILDWRELNCCRARSQKSLWDLNMMWALRFVHGTPSRSEVGVELELELKLELKLKLKLRL